MSAIRSRAGDALFGLVVVALAIVCAAGLWRALLIAGLQVPLDPNEGWNAYHARAAMSGGDLYPAPAAFMVNNYPPLSFYLVGVLGRLFHDDIFAGRVLSLIAFAGVALLIFAVARRLGCEARQAAFASLLFTAHALLDSDYVGMDDPQWIAHAIGLAAFLVLLKEPRTVPRVVAAGFLFVLAGFVKHNLVVLPLASALWLLIFDRRAAVAFIASGAGFAVAGLVLFRLAFGHDLLAELASSRIYSLANVEAGVSAWLLWGLVPLAGLSLLAWFERRDPAVILVALVAYLGLIVGTVLLGGDGVDVNAMFEADIGLCLGGALLLHRLVQRGIGYQGLAAAAYAAPLALGLVLAADSDWLTSGFWLRPMADDAATARGDIAFLRAEKGPAICETLALCYWAGKPPEVDVFNLGELYRTHARSDRPLVERLDRKYFRAVELDAITPFPLTSAIHDALMRNYRIARESDDGVFFVPK